MPENTLAANKNLIKLLSAALYDFEPSSVLSTLQSVFAAKAKIQLCYPFEDMDGVEDFYHTALLPLHQAVPDLERRDTIMLSGSASQGNWV